MGNEQEAVKEFQRRFGRDADLPGFDHQNFNSHLQFVEASNHGVEDFLRSTILELKDFAFFVADVGVAAFEVAGIEPTHCLFILDPAPNFLTAFLGDRPHQGDIGAARV